ncbi:hypothetical protein BYT27DRAFT_7342473 [Phlegmacium glaucopus]|nr:hypothetical protein BYT27DRAFT_7342473 [Phlegmacium glaucopus]
MAAKQQEDNILVRHTDTLLGSANLPQDHREAIGTLKSTYIELSDYLAQASWIERVETIQVQATYITSLAGVAVFLGAVQIGFIAYAAALAPSSNLVESNPSLVREVSDILSFCALLFDVLGALFALITSGTLLLRASEAKRFTIHKQKLCNDIVKALKTYKDIPGQRDNAQLSINRFRNDSQDYHRKAQEVAHLIDDHSGSYLDVILVIIAGVVFFFASFILFIINKQRLRVWVPTIAVAGATTMMLLYMQSRRRPAIGRVFLTLWKAC